MKFLCRSCGKTVELGFQPSFCPLCGGRELISLDAYTTAHARIAEVRALIPKIEKAWDRYGELHAQYERRLTILNQYKRRGHITDEEIPRLELRKLSDFLKDLRESEPAEQKPPVPRSPALPAKDDEQKPAKSPNRRAKKA